MYFHVPILTSAAHRTIKMSYLFRNSITINCFRTQKVTLTNLNQSKPIVWNNVRLFGNSGNSSRAGRTGRAFVKPTITPVKEGRSIKEILMQPTSGAPFKFGASMVAGASIFGIGALCYYGLGMSSTAGTYENSFAWPQHVRDRIKSTYFYFGSGLGISVGSAVAVFRSPVLLNMMSRNSFMALVGTMAAMIGTSILAQSIEYREGFGAKQLAWALHCGVVGAVIAPLCLVGGPLLLKAALYTAGVAGGLSAIAYCAPNDRFLYMGGPLAIGLGVVFAASVGSMFLPPTSALGASLFSISIYAGLLLFSAFLLYDTQKIIRKAETHPVYAMQPYDPVNASMGIYMDVINIFIRILAILSGSSKRK